MTKYEAHIILNEVREGVLHPQSVVIKALVTTGDIYARMVSNMHPCNCSDSSPTVTAAVLENQNGE